MTQRDPLPPGTEVAWLDIHGDGHEVERRGVVDSAAGTFGAERCWWVTPSDDTEVVRVARCQRRGAVGRAWPWTAQELDLAQKLMGTHPLVLEDDTRWRVGGGRTVERGSLYREVDTRSLLAQSTSKLRNQHERV